MTHSDLGRTSMKYFDNVTLTSRKPCQHNNKFECSETITIIVIEMKMIQQYFIENPYAFFSVTCMELVENADKISLDP